MMKSGRLTMDMLEKMLEIAMSVSFYSHAHQKSTEEP